MKNKKYNNLINGQLQGAAEYLSIFSPIDGSLIGETPSMSQKDIDGVMEAAKAAQPSWEKIPRKEKAKLLYKTADLLEQRVDEIAEIMMWEIAKSLKDAKNEIIRTADLLRYTADIGVESTGEIISGGSFDSTAENKHAFITRKAMGVVLAIAPFNYPVNLAASKIGPALMGGNAVVVKPASQGAISTLSLIKAFIDAGIPAGVVNSVTGKGSIIGDYIVTHSLVNFINFTGSNKVGEHIGKLAGIKPILCELGGKDAALVLPDADLDLSAKEIVAGAFSYSGQRCTAIKRVLVTSENADMLTNKLQKIVKELSVGMPQDNPTIVPVINNTAVEQTRSLYEDAIKKGATAILPLKIEKNLVYPTLLDNVTGDMDLAWVEPFSPILPIIRVQSVEEMIEVANASEYGLQSSVFSNDLQQAQKVSNALDVGTVQINNRTQRGPDNFPFLGIKKSGIGIQGIKYSIESMTQMKSIVVDM